MKKLWKMLLSGTCAFILAVPSVNVGLVSAAEPAAEEAATVPTQEAEEKGEPKAEEIKAEGKLFKRKNKVEKSLPDTAAESPAEQEPIETK